MKSNHPWRQKMFYAGVLFCFGLAAHFGYAAVHQDRILFRRAEQQYYAGNPGQALLFYHQALDLGLQLPQALIRTVEAALMAGDMAAMELGVNNLLASKNRPLPEELLSLTGLVDRFGRLDLARELLEHYPRQVLVSPELTLYLAGVYRRSGWYLEADLLYDRLADNPRLRNIAALDQAEMYAMKGKYGEAEDLLRDILRTEPENRSARIILGRILSWGGLFEEAIQEYKIALGDI